MSSASKSAMTYEATIHDFYSGTLRKERKKVGIVCTLNDTIGALSMYSADCTRVHMHAYMYTHRLVS